jgi:uncharacterized protein YdhG (YjbR/CyaY superfamily)
MTAQTIDGYTCTKGSLHFPVDAPLPESLVAELVTAKLRELDISP